MKKKNVLLFFTDDQRFNTINSLGCSEIKTPNLDKFVKAGTSFTHAHIMGGTTGAICMPSRAMLMSGRSLFHLYGEGKMNGKVIPKEHKTIPEVFRENGYKTHHIGKWHQDKKSFNRSFEDANRIFDFGGGYSHMGGHFNVPLHDYDPTAEYLAQNAYMLAADKETRNECGIGQGGVHSTELFCDSAVDFIENYSDERPFFLYLATVAPHDPRHTLDEFEGMYSTNNVSVPSNYMPAHPFDNGDLYLRDELLEGFPRTKNAIKGHIADYYAMITHIDYHFGRVMETLEKKGLMEDTIVIFAGDNGLALGQHGLMGKQNMYDHSLRVPFIIKGPSINKDIKIDSLCYLYDIFPTLCEYCDIDIPDSVEGISLKPLIDNEKETVRDELFCGYRNLQRCLRNKKFKLIEYYVGETRYTQLFDMENDKDELKDLSRASAYKNILEAMRERLYNEQVKADDPLVCKTKEELETDIW